MNDLHNHQKNHKYGHERTWPQPRKESERLIWAGHLIRMDEDDPTRKVYKGNIYLSQDARQLLGMSNWWTSAQNRDVWSSLLRQA